MARKVILVADPGIDAAFALALALYDPQLDLLAVAATAGIVGGEQATRNVHGLIEYFDPPRWPRVGESLPLAFDLDGAKIHGSDGLGGLSLQCAELHRPHPADRVVIEEVRAHLGEVTIVSLGPLTVLARAMDRDPDFAKQARQLIVLGGSWHEPGNASTVAEFNFYCDPLSARQVIRSGLPITLLPLDLAKRVLYSPTEVAELLLGETREGQLLRKMAQSGLAASAQHLGIEGFHLTAVLGVLAAASPGAFKTRPAYVDVETQGELTRGMSVIDFRSAAGQANVDLAVDVDAKMARAYVDQILREIPRNED